MVYTICGSLPLLGCIIYLEKQLGGCHMYSLKILGMFLKNRDYSIYCVCWILAFLIKLPIYGVHLWLPKAHVEAPVAGSMVLAGILLKLGAYGLLRTLSFLDLDRCVWAKYLFFWGVVRMCIVGFICFRQSDLKSFVAYSSIAHMSVILAACFSYDTIGYIGAISMLISHGLCSSGLFFGVQCLYKKRGTRKIFINRGWINICPTLCFFWFLLCIGNASTPPSLKLIREFFLFSSIVSFGERVSAILCGLLVFLGGLIRIYLYVLVCHGYRTKYRYRWSSLKLIRRLVIMLHIIPLFGLLFLSKYIYRVV